MTNTTLPPTSPEAHEAARLASSKIAKQRGPKPRVYGLAHYQFGKELAGLKDNDLAKMKAETAANRLADMVLSENPGFSRPHTRTVQEDASAILHKIRSERAALR